MLLVPILLSSSALPAQDGAAPDLWRALPLPALCRAEPQSLEAPRLLHGSHLVVTKEDSEAGLARAAGAALSTAAFASLLSEESRREAWAVTLHPTVPPLLVRGPQAGCDAAAAFCEQLDAAARALDVELGVWLVRGPGTAAPQAAAPKDAPWASARVRSGAELMFGERSSQSYVHNYSVEVATDAGVAAPVVGRVLSGDVLHVRAMRARGGAAVFVEGLLDLSKLDSIEDFELSATDLGSVQHPHVSALQVAFSGTVASGAPLRVAWSGIPGAEAGAEGSLWIVPRCAPDATSGRWRVLDTALLEATPWELPQVSPGGGLELADAPEADPELPQPLASALLAKEGEVSRGGSSRSRALFSGGNGVVLGPRGEQEGWAAIERLRDAVEALRTRTGELAVQRGGASVRLPVASGARWRVLVASETTAVIDYDVEIAPETWMPGPRVERRIDGFCAQGVATLRESTYSAWFAASAERKVAERSSVPLGRLELPRRTWRAARGELRAGEAAVAALGGASPLSLAWRVP